MTSTTIAAGRTIRDTVGPESAVDVTVDYEDHGPSIRIEEAATGATVNLGVKQAYDVGRWLIELADSLTPATAQGLAVLEVPLKAINDARGTSHTLASLAAACDVDLEHASEADAGRMASYIGGVLCSRTTTSWSRPSGQV